MRQRGFRFDKRDPLPRSPTIREFGSQRQAGYAATNDYRVHHHVIILSFSLLTADMRKPRPHNTDGAFGDPAAANR